MAGSDARLAARIAHQHGLPGVVRTEVTGLGSVNHVLVVGDDHERYVVRFAVDADRPDEFQTEAWCMRVAIKHGIPAPEPIAHGVLEGTAYAIQRFIPHLRLVGTHEEMLWRTLGGYARTLSQLPVVADAPAALFSRFGRDLPAAWRSHLAYNRAELTGDDPLLQLGAYPRDAQPQLHADLVDLANVSMTFGLCHGDLGLRNVLIAPNRPPVLVDWGSASYGPAPYTDLLVLLRDAEREGHPDDVEFRAFAHGNGFDLNENRSTLDAFRRLSVLDTVRWALAGRPTLLPGLLEQARNLFWPAAPTK